MQISHTTISNVSTGNVCTWWKCSKEEFLEHVKGCTTDGSTHYRDQRHRGISSNGENFALTYSDEARK